MQTTRGTLHSWEVPLPFNTSWKMYKISRMLQNVRSRFLAEERLSSFVLRNIR